MKKLLSMILAIIMVFSCLAITASAEETTEIELVSGVLNFDANVSEWKDFTKVYCHIWAYGGDGFYAWQSKKERCTDDDGDGIWTYDLAEKAIELEVGKLYAVIFSNDNGTQTFNLLFDSTVLGDTAYGTDNEYESPEDSSKKAQAGFWKGQDPAVFGPELCITSIGNVVGTCIPNITTAQSMFEDFLANTKKLDNVRTYSGKTDQQILDDIAVVLALTVEDVEDAIANTAAVVEWTAEASTIGGSDEEVYKLGDVDGNSEINILDATVIQLHLASLEELGTASLNAADADRNGEVAIGDVTQIQLLVAKLIPEL